MIRVGEAIVQFSSLGFADVMGQIGSIQTCLSSLTVPTLNFSGITQGIASVTAGAGGGLDLGGDLAEDIAGWNLDNAIDGLKGVADATREIIPTIPPVVNGLGKLSGMNFRILSASIGQMVPALAPVTGIVSSINMAFMGLGTTITGVGVALGIGTGGLFFILVAIAAAITSIGFAFKKAFDGDEEAQRQWASIAESISSIAATVGGPLVDAFKKLAGPMADGLMVLDLYIKKFMGVLTISDMVNASAAAFERHGMTGAASAKKDGGRDGDSGGQFMGILEFAKSLQAGVNKTDDPVVKEQKETNQILKRIERKPKQTSHDYGTTQSTAWGQ